MGVVGGRISPVLFCFAFFVSGFDYGLLALVIVFEVKIGLMKRDPLFSFNYAVVHVR